MSAVVPDTRKDWDQQELEIAGAINVGALPRPTISRALHSLLTRDKWNNINDDDFRLLLPSLRLASNLIAAGTDYLTEFLGPNDIHEDLAYRAENQREHVIDLQGGPWTDRDLQRTRSSLEEIAEDIEWSINYTLGDHGALGMTRHIKEGYYAKEPWGPIDVDAIQESDRIWKLKARINRRPLLVGIMSQYIQALRDHAPETEVHVRALFHAAVTITHEIGHVVWCQNYSDLNYNKLGIEPYVGNYATAELGFCFEAYLFSGFHVRTAKVAADIPLDFEVAAVWNPYLTVDLTRRPDRLLYRTQYSISIEYMQRLLTQTFWDNLGDQTANDFSERAVEALRPATDVAVDPFPATANVRNWAVTKLDGRVAWIGQYADRASDPALIGRIPRSEIELVKDELRPFYKKTMPGLQNPFGEDDDEFFDFEAEDYEIDETANLTPEEAHRVAAAKQPYIDDGVGLMDHESNTSVLSFALTRVEVKYLPAKTVKAVTFKRARSDGDDDDPAAKRRKPNFSDKYGTRTIDDLLEKNLHEVFEEWTRTEARDYAIKESLDPGPEPPEEARQRSRLDRSIVQDSYMIERLRCYHFSLFEDEFDEDKSALVKIKEARLESCERWAPNDIQQLCDIQGLFSSGDDPATLLPKAIRWLKLDLADAKAVLKVADPADVTQPIPTKDYDSWNDAQFKDFFRKNNLPDWGHPSTCRLRVERFREQEDTGSRPYRGSIMANRDGHPHLRVEEGVELYGFDIALERTTVTALKSDLFRVAVIPANHDINLYFGNDRKKPLENGTQLSSYGEQGWKEIEMTTVRREAAKPVAVPTIPVYTPRFALKDVANNSNGGGSNKNGKSLPPIDPATKRNYDTRKGNEVRTFSERMQAISRRGADLERVVTVGGGLDPLRPHLKSVLASSTSEMLDTLEDILEVNAEKEKQIDKYVEEYGKAIVPDETLGTLANEIPPGAPEHMTDVFRRLKAAQFSGKI